MELLRWVLMNEAGGRSELSAGHGGWMLYGEKGKLADGRSDENMKERKGERERSQTGLPAVGRRCGQLPGPSVCSESDF